MESVVGGNLEPASGQLSSYLTLETTLDQTISGPKASVPKVRLRHFLTIHQPMRRIVIDNPHPVSRCSISGFKESHVRLSVSGPNDKDVKHCTILAFQLGEIRQFSTETQTDMEAFSISWGTQVLLSSINPPL